MQHWPTRRPPVCLPLQLLSPHDSVACATGASTGPVCSTPCRAGCNTPCAATGSIDSRSPVAPLPHHCDDEPLLPTLCPYSEPITAQTLFIDVVAHTHTMRWYNINRMNSTVHYSGSEYEQRWQVIAILNPDGDFVSINLRLYCLKRSAVMPPSTIISVPVINPDWALPRNTTISPISRGVPNRPIG